MFANRLFAGTAATAAIMTASLAMAQPPVGPDPDSRPNIDVYGQSMKLPNAIEAIERQTGGRVLKIRSDGGDYSAVVAKDGGVSDARVDGTGQVVAVDANPTPEALLSVRTREDIRSLYAAAVPLPDAILTAEAANRGATAVTASLAVPVSGDSEVIAYSVDVVRNGHSKRIAISGDTGQVIADPGALGIGAP